MRPNRVEIVWHAAVLARNYLPGLLLTHATFLVEFTSHLVDQFWQ